MIPEEQKKRNDALVKDVGYARILPKLLIEEMHFAGCKDPSDASWRALRQLAREKPNKKPLIVYFHDKNGSPVSGFSFAALTEAGAKHLNVPRERAWPMEPGPINHNLAVGTYVFTHRKLNCVRLEPEHVSTVLGIEAPTANVSHVMQTHRGRPAVFRVYVTSLAPSEAAKAMGDIIEEARDDKELWDRIKRGDYGFLLLTPTASAAADAEDSVRHLRKICRVHVGVGPTSSEIVDFLSERKKKWSGFSS